VAGRLFGVLALQGDFEAHRDFLTGLGHVARFVRCRAELEGIEGLILPGGESTAMLRLMAPERLVQEIKDLVLSGMPVLGTCAGLILLARKVLPDQESIGVLNVGVERNGYGRQVFSEVLPLRVSRNREEQREGVFIRAPRIYETGSGVEVLAWREEDPVLVRQGNIIGAGFHPELGQDPWVHKLWLEGIS